MKYFVTGANGLLGSHIVRRLLEQGHEVRALRRAGSDLSMLGDAAGRVEWLEGDVLDVTSLAQGVAGADYVVHAAAVLYFGSSGLRHQMAKVNIEGTQNVVNACVEAGTVKKLCYISSVAAIGRGSQRDWVTEEDKWEDGDNHSFYGFTKYHGELEVWRGVAEGQDAVVVNPALVLGAGNWNAGSLSLFKYGWQGKPLMPQGTLNYVDVRDVAEAVLLLLDSGIRNERFILAGGQVLYKDFFQMLHRRFGKQPSLIDFQPWMAAIAWRVSAVMSWLGMKPLITKETAASSRSHTKFDGGKIARALPFRYHSLDETLDWACAYFSEASNR
jgi:nucleoside-diphosphate-sugar epimerase